MSPRFKLTGIGDWNLKSVLDLSGGWGFNPLWCLSTPKFSLTPQKIVKNNQKYIGFTTNRVLPKVATNAVQHFIPTSSIVYWGSCVLVTQIRVGLALSEHVITTPGRFRLSLFLFYSEQIKIESLRHDHHHQLNVHFLPRSIKGMDGCFPIALGRQSTFNNIWDLLFSHY